MSTITPAPPVPPAAKPKDAFEAYAKEALIDVAAAKAALRELDAKFGGQHGRIPDGALIGIVNQYLMGQAREFFTAVVRTWEDELASTLPADRKKERELTPEQWIKERGAKAAADAKAKASAEVA